MVAVLASSCSNELLEEAPSSNAGISNGITFSVVEDEATRGMVNSNWSSFFFAEQDKVGIYADQVMQGTTAVNGYTNKYIYKATKSAGAPWLAGVDDNNVLTYKSSYANNVTPSFFVVYPQDATVTYASDKFTITPAATLATQTTDGTRMNFNSRILYQYIAQKPANDWNSVGESMNVKLALTSPLSMLYFTVNDIENYDAFGKLETIKLDATGAYWMDGTTKQSVAASPLSYASDDKFESNIKNEISLKKGQAPQPTSIILTVNANIKNGTKANMFVIEKNPVRNINGANKTVTDAYTITYTFENIDLVYNKKKSAGQWVKNMVYGMPSEAGLNIATEYPWLLTRGTAGNNDRTLYVNSGNVKDIVADATNIKWTDTRAAGKVPYTEVKKIVIAAGVNDLTNDDWAILRKCTNATSLTINNKTAKLESIEAMTSLEEVVAPNVTEVVQDAFKGLNTQITKLHLNSVTSYGDTNTAAFTKLADLNMASYEFGNAAQDVATKFFNANVKGTLVKCDISSVESLSPVFGYSRNILFTDYASLEEIALNSKCTIIAANEFKGCSSLKKVTGVVEMSTANNAFEGAGAAGSDVTVNMYRTDIPEGAFKGSNIKTIKYNGAAIQPTTIGTEAFMNNTVIKLLDLSAATSIGESAFNGATSFIGREANQGSGVVNLIVETVPADAFNGTAVIRFQLKNATTVCTNSLASTALQQIKFRQNVNAWNAQTSKGIQPGFAGSRTSVTDLFVKALSDLNAFTDTFGTRTVEDSEWEF